MWTIFRFALSDADPRAYEEAYEILEGAGFSRAPDPVAGRRGVAPFPAAVMADVRQDTAAVTRAIFDRLGEARLRPLAVTGCRARSRRRAARAAPGSSPAKAPDRSTPA
jgi:hypothetical protein